MFSFSNYKKIHFIGIGGISMSALAKFTIKEGVSVSGSDEKLSALTEELQKMGAKIFGCHDAGNLAEDVDLVIYSPAISKENPELEEAKRRGVEILNRRDFLARVSGLFEFNIAISGSHGKTTTTAMLAHVFNSVDVPLCVHVGGECFDINGNLLYSNERMLFVTEACEYVDSFLSLTPNYSAILNIQSDHMDYFKTEERLIASFSEFANKTTDFVFVNFNDKNCLKACKNIEQDKIVGLSVEDFSERKREGIQPKILAKNLTTNSYGCVAFDGYFEDKFLGRFSLSIFGSHNVYNALMVVALAYYYGLDMCKVKEAIKRFSGIKRRYQEVGKINGARVVHDYAHHPTEIKKVIEETRVICKGRVIVVFQPHTYSRTRDLLDDFVSALCVADDVVMYPIYSAREQPIDGVTSYAVSFLIRKNGGRSVHFVTYEEIIVYLKETAKPEDVVLVLGAGDIVELCDKIKV